MELRAAPLPEAPVHPIAAPRDIDAYTRQIGEFRGSGRSPAPVQKLRRRADHRLHRADLPRLQAAVLELSDPDRDIELAFDEVYRPVGEPNPEAQTGKLLRGVEEKTADETISELDGRRQRYRTHRKIARLPESRLRGADFREYLLAILQVERAFRGQMRMSGRPDQKLDGKRLLEFGQRADHSRQRLPQSPSGLRL